MDKDLSAALDVVLRDVRSHCAVQPDVREGEVRSWEEPFVWLYAPDGSGRGVSAPSGGGAEQIAGLADQVQEWAVEALWSEGLSAVWPQCPAHPDSHPLSAAVEGGTAVWSCPRTRSVVAPIGRLAGPPEDPGGRP
ncbi:hypothetical protein [Streptosporangium sp. KLBMP 9127]|nr:hypothetical protein [Streptosporangium sp. KLBMP 9127]